MPRTVLRRGKCAMGREKGKEIDEEKERKRKGISGGVLSPIVRELGC